MIESRALFYHRPEHGSFTAQKTCIRRDVRARCGGQHSDDRNSLFRVSFTVSRLWLQLLCISPLREDLCI
jgi:hypothetical protein